MRTALISASLWASWLWVPGDTTSRGRIPFSTSDGGHFWVVLIAFIEYLILALIPVVALAWISRKGAGGTNDALEMESSWMVAAADLGRFVPNKKVNPTPRNVLEGTIWTLWSSA